MGRDPLAELLLTGDLGETVEPFRAAALTAWNAATYENTVADGAATWSNLAVVNPSLLVLGRVLLGHTRAGPVILGNSYVYIPTPAPEV